MTRTNASASAIESYVKAGHGDPNDLRASIVDLITDLLHFAEAHGHDPRAAARIAVEHWSNEK